MNLMAHRGGSKYDMENSLEAIKKALEYTSNIEIDVRRCGTGEIIVIHDPTVSENGESVLVKNKSLEELKIISEQNMKREIPTLKEVLKILPEKTTLNVEIKETEIINDTLQILKGNKDINIIISSFLENPLCSTPSKYNPAYIFVTGWRQKVKKARKMNCKAIHPTHYLLDKTRVQEVQRNGMKVRPWLVNDKEKYVQMKNLGVDAVISDGLREKNKNS